jgi:methionine-rich copper-binding protein CopC
MKLHTRPETALILILAMLLLPLIASGCGGAGGSGSPALDGQANVQTGSYPVVTGTDPANQAVGVPLNKTIAVTFSEPVQPLATNFWNLISVSDGMSNVAITKTITGSVLYIDPVSDLNPNTTYTVNLPKNCVGAVTPVPGGNNAAGAPLKDAYTFRFTTSTVVLPTAPVVTGSDPASGATGVSTGKTITVTFDKAIVSGDNWDGIILRQGASAVQTSVSINPADEKVLVIDPVSSLAVESTFVLTVPAGAVKDKASATMPLASDFSLTFSTIGPPTVTGTDPANGSTGISWEKTITVTFSKNVLEGSAYDGITLTTGGTSVPVTKTLEGNTLTIDPENSLEKFTSYTVTIPAGAVNDDQFIPLAVPYTFSFVTADPPVVTATDPVGGAINVPTNKVITVTFSKSIEQGPAFGGISLDTQDGPIPAASAISGNVLTITPDSLLSQDTVFTVNIPAGAVKGATVNNIPGDPLSDPYSFSFLSGYPPVVLSTHPANGAVKVAQNTIITVLFNESILPASEWGGITLKAGQSTVAADVTYSGDTLTITPASKLLANKTYTVTVPAGAVRDLAGNVTTAGTSFGFTTDNVIFFETFNQGIPADWTIIDGYNDGITWTAINPELFNIGSPFTNPCGIVQSNNYAGAMDEHLISPDIDCSISTGQLYLSFANCFTYYTYNLNEIADVDISNNGGASWTNVLRMTGTSYGPELRTINITNAAAGYSQVRVRFHYYNARNEIWWLVDDVKFYCTP